ncbi:hypothetical protein LIER_28080 [Lithospermum erythrorhizon]|uniref:glucose-6-phosphate 1-epimerase n=1 Tax=Lithospermum erythrorhizon TaxID=34254 RepID=A0AAV3REA5_LITER
MKFPFARSPSWLIFLFSSFLYHHFSTASVARDSLLVNPLHVNTKAPGVKLGKGINGLDKIILQGKNGASSEIYLYGAHLTSWKNPNGTEFIFVSKNSNFEPPKPIRGGIPICFPQFSSYGPLPSHGFARNRFWKIEKNPPPFSSSFTIKSKAFVDLILTPTAQDLEIWPHKFEFRLRAGLKNNGDLILISRVKNIDKSQFNFTFAFHTYFSVGDISEVTINGLQNLDYLDNTRNRTRFTGDGKPIVINSEYDRVFLDTPSRIAIKDGSKKQRFVVHKDGIADAVVWNPWEKKAKTIVDFVAEEYKEMVAVEAAVVGKPIKLIPGAQWIGTLQLSALKSQF